RTSPEDWWSTIWGSPMSFGALLPPIPRRGDGKDSTRPGRSRGADAGQARGLRCVISWLRLVAMAEWNASTEAHAPASRAGAHLGAGGRKEPALARRDRTFASICVGR